MSYKNRQRRGWCSKKETKEKIYRERQHGKKEIAQAQEEILQGDDFRYPKHGKRKQNVIAQLTYRIKFYAERMVKAKLRGDDCRWTGYSSWKSMYEKTNEELKRRVDEKEKKI